MVVNLIGSTNITNTMKCGKLETMHVAQSSNVFSQDVNISQGTKASATHRQIVVIKLLDVTIEISITTYDVNHNT